MKLKQNRFFLSAMAVFMGIQFGSSCFASEYSQEEFDYYTNLLSHLIEGEVQGCDEETKKWVGSVVLNRVESEKFPDSIEDVIYQPGQYACTWDGNFNKTPSDETIEVVKDLLTNGSAIPEDVVFQAEFLQGSGEWDHKDCPNGVRMYFCYQ